MISTDRKLYYPMLLLLSTDNKKTAEALSRLFDMSGDTLLRILDNESVDWNDLINRVKLYFGNKKIEIIIDDSIIKKMYSKYIEGSCDNFDPVSKQTFRSICTVVAMISDGKTALPVLHKFWVNKNLCSEDYYQTKTQIAQELIQNLIDHLDIKLVLMDGLYATVEMVKWCNEKKIYFEMRFHANRKIAVDLNNPDHKVKLSEYKELKLIGKKTCRTVKALWHGQLVYITAVKRFKKDGSFIIVYQISNVNTTARNHVLAYNRRWYVEMFFRTAKQHLGLADCQSRKKSLQENHIYNVFLAYIILQFERRKAKLKNPEEALYAIKGKKNVSIYSHIERAKRIFRNNEGVCA